MPTVTFDVDGTLADHDAIFCKLVRRDYDIEFYPEDINTWNTTIDELGMDITEVMETYDQRDYYPEMEVVEPAAALARKLSEQGVHINIATHRDASVRDITADWLEEHDIPFDDLYCDSDLAKETVAGDALLDDKYMNVEAVAYEGALGVLVLRYFNHTHSLDHENLVSAQTKSGMSPFSLIENPSLQWDVIEVILSERVLNA